MNAHAKMLICLCFLGLAACDDGGNAEATDAAPTLDAAPIAADAAVDTGPDLAELIAAQRACEAETLVPPDLAGPGMDTPPDGPVIASATVLYLNPGPASRAKFNEVIGPIAVTLSTADGLLGMALTYDERCGVARTFTVWRDRAAMYGFVGSEAHVAAINAQAIIGLPASAVTSWAVAPEDFPPTWAEAVTAVEAAPTLGD